MHELTWKLKNPEKSGLWKTLTIKIVGNSSMQEKIRRSHRRILLALEICYEETFKEAFWKSNYWGFLGRQKMCLKNKSDSKSDK